MGLIPPFFFDSVVAIGVGDPRKKQIIASGFLYGDFVEKDDKGNNVYRVYLVTNRHVLEGKKSVWLRFNPQKADQPARDYRLMLLDKSNRRLWFTPTDETIDVAVAPIQIARLKEHAMRVAYFRSDHDVANIERLGDLGIMEGDFAYVLGFPMGIIGKKRNIVVARSGIIAQIRDALTEDSTEYLIDAFVFPGNSGGPVVSKPEAFAIRGTKSQNAAYLVGVVKGYVPYRDIAISSQTNRPRVIFEENSGLAAVHPIDFVQEAIKSHYTYLEMEQKTHNES